MLKVSIVIPAYNAMKYLPSVLESVLNQTFTDFEVLIVNDGSSDEIVSWLSQQSDPRIKLISQHNQGLSAARNTGIAHAQGEYIAFLDADDFWDPTKLEKHVNCLDKNPQVGLVHSWIKLVDPEGRLTGRIMGSNVEGNAWKKMLERNLIACPSVMVRRNCFETVGMFDRALRAVEDWDMWIRIAAQYPFAVVKEPLVYYRQLPGSLSKNYRIMEESFHAVIEKAFHKAPPEVMHLKQRSYGYANLCLAWKALQSSDRNYQQALHFRQQALMQYPQLRYSNDFIRLSIAILAMRSLGSNTYSKLLLLVYALRRQLLKFIKFPSTYSDFR